MDELIEPIAVADIYADGIASVELVGGDNVRITFFVHQQIADHPPVRVVCARIVRPRASIMSTQILEMLETSDAPNVSQE